MAGTCAKRGTSTSPSSLAADATGGFDAFDSSPSPITEPAELACPVVAALALVPLTFRDVFPDASPLRFALPNQ